jgi:hypothetical protein
LRPVCLGSGFERARHCVEHTGESSSGWGSLVTWQRVPMPSDRAGGSSQRQHAEHVARSESGQPGRGRTAGGSLRCCDGRNTAPSGAIVNGSMRGVAGLSKRCRCQPRPICAAFVVRVQLPFARAVSPSSSVRRGQPRFHRTFLVISIALCGFCAENLALIARHVTVAD